MSLEIPKDLWSSEELTWMDKTIYVELRFRQEFKVNTKKLAKKMGVTREEILQSMARLILSGWVDAQDAATLARIGGRDRVTRAPALLLSFSSDTLKLIASKLLPFPLKGKGNKAMKLNSVIAREREQANEKIYSVIANDKTFTNSKPKPKQISKVTKTSQAKESEQIELLPLPRLRRTPSPSKIKDSTPEEKLAIELFHLYPDLKPKGSYSNIRWRFLKEIRKPEFEAGFRRFVKAAKEIIAEDDPRKKFIPSIFNFMLREYWRWKPEDFFVGGKKKHSGISEDEIDFKL